MINWVYWVKWVIIDTFAILFLSLLYTKGKERFVQEEPSHVPRIVHQIITTPAYSCYEDIPSCIQHVIETNKFENPKYDFRLYTDDNIKSYLTKNVPDYILNAYNLINPLCGAGKADFFRYIVLYYEGGVYIDLKMDIAKTLESWVQEDPDTLKITLLPWLAQHTLDSHWPDGHKPNSEHREMCIGAMVYPKKHWVLKLVIDEMIKVINEIHTTGIQDPPGLLAITGPFLYTSVVAPQLPNLKYKLYEKGFYDDYITTSAIDCYYKDHSDKKVRWDESKIKIIL